MRDYNRLIKKIKRASRLFGLVLVALLILCACLPLAWYVLLPIYLVVAFFAFGAVGLKLTRMGQSPLLDDLNPYQYHYVMHQSGLALRDARVDIVTASATGDYGVVIDLCTRALEGQKKEALCAWYLHALCGALLGSGDTDAYRLTRERYDALVSASKHPERYEKLYGDERRAMQLLADEDLAGFVALARERLKKPGVQKMPYLEADLYYDLAIGLYLSGEHEEAKGYFEQLAARCPLLCIGRRSALHLQRMQEGEAPRRITFPEDRPEGVQFPVGGMPGQQKKQVGLGRWIVLLLCFVVIFGCVFSLARDARGRETPLEAIEAEGVTVSDLCHTLPVGEDGDLLCLYVADEGYLDEAFYVPYVAYLEEDDGYYRHVIDVEIWPEDVGSLYVISIADADLEISFSIYAHERDVPAGREAYAFTLEERVYYLCVEDVVSTPVRFNGVQY